jgi:hypothetical protein
MNSDLSYHRRRASEERTAALHARDPQARRVHIGLAEQHEARVRSMSSVEHQLPPRARPENVRLVG